MKRDPGAYIGRLPERSTETIPGVVSRSDEQVAAVATRPGLVRGAAPEREQGAPPDGHRAPGLERDDARREAGERH